MLHLVLRHAAHQDIFTDSFINYIIAVYMN